MTNSIVSVSVTQTIAPTPQTLQSSGALISQGGTTLAQYASQLLTQLSDLTAILAAPLSVTSLTWSAGVATVTAAAAHGITNGDTFLTTIAGADQAYYNGTFLATATGAETFTFALAGTSLTSPATGSLTYTTRNVAELVAMATTFFAQGSQQGVSVLELGAGEDTAAIAALGTYLTNNPNSSYVPGSEGYFYSYLVPRSWSSDSGFLTFLAGFEATTSKTYFFVTMTTGNYSSFTDLMKCVVGLVEAPSIPATEFSLAAALWVTLNYAPSSTNKVTPLAFAFLLGVTAYPTKGNNATLAALKAAAVNYVGTGAEGGITNTILLWGTTMDGRQFNYWYSVDAVQINVNVDISNAVINGSNNPANPLYLEQEGINRLQAVGAQTLSNLITYGLATGSVTQTALSPSDLQTAIDSGAFNGELFINAVPYLTYYAQNPGDYKIGKYAGFTIGYITQNGFIAILFNINVSDFITQ